MGTFPYTLSWEVLPSGRRRLLDELVYILDADQAKALLADFDKVKGSARQHEKYSDHKRITAPGCDEENEGGFVTDGASIPRPLWTLVGSPFTGKYTKAAVIHDWLCENKICSRKLGDDIFLRAMKDSKVNYFKRYTIYWGVRAYAIATGLK